MPRFYVNYELAIANQYALPENVVRHINVLRLKEGTEIIIFNGDGNNYLAQIIKLAKREILVKIIAVTPANNQSKLNLNLAISIISADKFDLVLQKAVELGVNKVIPLYTQNTQRFRVEKLESRIEHWSKVIIAASEQCGRSELAQLDYPLEVADLMSLFTDADKFILSPYHSANGQLTDSSRHKLLLVGPEGGFTANEVDMAVNNGFQPIKLGPRILRAETAAIAGISYLHSCYGDFL